MISNGWDLYDINFIRNKVTVLVLFRFTKTKHKRLLGSFIEQLIS